MEARFQILTAASVKVTVLWEMALCSLVEVGVCRVLTTMYSN
jgi:hypothetical protein